MIKLIKNLIMSRKNKCKSDNPIGNCYKTKNNDKCCCNCNNHYEDFYHCFSYPKPIGVSGCVCDTHKGWTCLISLDGERPVSHSDWNEHGVCEFWIERIAI